jgi:hypothetical protein
MAGENAHSWLDPMATTVLLMAGERRGAARGRRASEGVVRVIQARLSEGKERRVQTPAGSRQVSERRHCAHPSQRFRRRRSPGIAWHFCIRAISARVGCPCDRLHSLAPIVAQWEVMSEGTWRYDRVDGALPGRAAGAIIWRQIAGAPR